MTTGHLPPSRARSIAPQRRDDGYVLLGMIAEATTGRPLQDLYREMVFDPAEMRSRMPRTSASIRGDGSGLRLGLTVFDIDGTVVFGHGGGWGSMMLISPDDGLVAVASINNSDGSPAAVSGAVQAMRLALRQGR